MNTSPFGILFRSLTDADEYRQVCPWSLIPCPYCPRNAIGISRHGIYFHLIKVAFFVIYSVTLNKEIKIQLAASTLVYAHCKIKERLNE